MPSTSKQSLLRYTLGNAVALLFGFSLCFGLLMHSGLSAKQWDFLCYYSVSHLVLEGHGGHLYDMHVLGQLESTVAYPFRLRPSGLPYVYPPYLALILAPLASLPYNVAYLLWLTINALVLSACMYALEQYARLEGRPAMLFRLACYSCLPVVVALLQGQTSVLVLGILTLSFFALRSGRETQVGAVIAFLLIKPPYLVPFLILLLAQRRWRALAASVLVASALLGIPVILFGPSILPSYGHMSVQAAGWHDNSVSGFDAPSNRAYLGFVQLLVPMHFQSAVTATLDAATLAALALFAWHQRRIDRQFALAVIAALLIAPHVLVHDLTLLAIPAAVVVRYRGVGPRHSTALLASVYAAIIVGFGLSYVAPIQLSVVAMLAMSFWICRQQVAEKRPVVARQSTPYQQPAAS